MKHGECLIKNTRCIMWIKYGCSNIMHTGKCALDTGLDPELYAINVHCRTLTELTVDRLWCSDIRDLITNKQFCPISLEIVNKLDQIALARMKEIKGNKLQMRVYGH